MTKQRIYFCPVGIADGILRTHLMSETHETFAHYMRRMCDFFGSSFASRGFSVAEVEVRIVKPKPRRKTKRASR